MWSGLVVVLHPLPHHPLHVSTAHDLDPVKALSATRTDLPLHISVRCRGRDRSLSLIPQEGHALLVARWQILEFPNPAPMTRMGEAELIEWDGSQEAVWDTFRWIFDPTQALAEYDLEVKLFSTAASEPLVLRYTLRPSYWTGPLELVPRA
jgi:hypothetical protein